MLADHNFYSLEAEQMVLGTIILNNEYYKSVSDTLDSSHFFFPQHQAAFAKIVEALKDESLANAVTLRQFFDSEPSIKESGGSLYLGNLLSAASSVIDIRQYANLIIDNFQKRLQLDIFKKGILDLENKSAVIVAGDVGNELAKINNESQSVAVFGGEEMASGLQELWKKDLTASCIPSKIDQLDKMLNGGFYPKKLYIVGAAPGAGKTSFAQQLILNGLRKGIPCLFFSIEIEKENVFVRFLSALSKINPFRIIINNIYHHEVGQFEAACAEWKSLENKFFMTDRGGISVTQIEATIKRVKKKSPIGLVVVDYVQIIPTRDSKNLNEATLIKENITALKDMAKKYDVTMVALSQITKDALGGRPGLKSLKGSGGIAEGADAVINMWTDAEETEEGQSEKNLNLEVAKNRNGIKGSFAIKFDGEFGIFKNNSNNNF